ncbi:LolA family protein [Rhodovibrio salinarum]|nr:outer-membrane lipoprotein carrier protein LolA [Rhodovibrio salinarum]
MRRSPTALTAVFLAATLATTVGLSAPAAMANNPDAPDRTQQAAATSGLQGEDQQTIDRIEAYLTGIETLHGRFVQAASSGGQATGEVWLKRPGKLRFEYDAPANILIVSNGNMLLYFDRELEQTSYVPLSETPLAFLVKDEVDLQNSEDYHVAGLERGEDEIAVWVAQEGVEAGQPGSLRLVLDADPLALKRWRVVDQQGTVTRVSLNDVRTDIALDDDLFDFGEIEGRPVFNNDRRGR